MAKICTVSTVSTDNHSKMLNSNLKNYLILDRQTQIWEKEQLLRKNRNEIQISQRLKITTPNIIIINNGLLMLHDMNKVKIS